MHRAGIRRRVHRGDGVEWALQKTNSAPQMRRGGAAEREPDRAKPQLERRRGDDQEIDFVEQHHPPPSIDASPYRARAFAAAALLN